ncbi:MAG: flagellar M-ring protein FliF [Spirochaeta sp. LUC14_002_19_P3]|nr:MAG: flagellar M-ring protein FliF [Spirochaeta sp. LUC14_002_19_P3]
MIDWLKKFFGKLKDLWLGWSLMKKLVFIGIIVVIVGAFVLLGFLSSQPPQAVIFNTTVTDELLTAQISAALDAENIAYTKGADGRFYVKDDFTARQARTLLVREDLLPGQLDPWNFFTNMDRWTLTDFDRDVNLQRALTNNLEQHISALSDVDTAKVTLVMPETQLFAQDQNPVTASVIIYPRPGSDITENKGKVEGIVKLIQFAVEGLVAENITIVDHKGTVLNDFSGMEDVDRLNLTNRMLRQKRALEAQYTAAVLASLGNVFTPSRVNIVNLDIDLEFIKKSIETQEFYPITMKEDNPNTPYSELEVVPSIIRSRENSSESFEGTGFNPEGPPGQEGQTPPAYQDLTNLVGQYESDRNIENNEINQRSISEEKSPYEIKRISLGIVLDGVWSLKYDENNKPVVGPEGRRERTYTPVDETVLREAQAVVESAVGFSKARGDVVTVKNISFDRIEQFRIEDTEWMRKQQNQKIILWTAVGLASIIFIFVLVRGISKQLERRRREQEELLARQHQAMREQALREAEEEGMEIGLSVEERARMDLQDNAKNLAREYPDDVAHLIQTWLAMEN